MSKSLLPRRKTHFSGISVFNVSGWKRAFKKLEKETGVQFIACGSILAWRSDSPKESVPVPEAKARGQKAPNARRELQRHALPWDATSAVAANFPDATIRFASGVVRHRPLCFRSRLHRVAPGYENKGYPPVDGRALRLLRGGIRSPQMECNRRARRIVANESTHKIPQQVFGLRVPCVELPAYRPSLSRERPLPLRSIGAPKANRCKHVLLLLCLQSTRSCSRALPSGTRATPVELLPAEVHDPTPSIPPRAGVSRLSRAASVSSKRGRGGVHKWPGYSEIGTRTD